MSNQERDINIQTPSEKRVKDVVAVYQKLESILKDVDFNPTDPLNVLRRITHGVSQGGFREDLSQGTDVKRGLTLMNGIAKMAQYSYAIHIMDHLEAIVESDLDNSVYFNMSECQEDSELVKLVNDVFIGINPEVVKQITEEGKMDGIQTVVNLLCGQEQKEPFKRSAIEFYAPEEYVEDGSVFRLLTKVSGVEINYFFPTEDTTEGNWNENVEPTISLLVNPLR